MSCEVTIGPEKARAVLDRGEWSCPDGEMLARLRLITDPARHYPLGYLPEPDRGMAEAILRDFPGRFVILPSTVIPTDPVPPGVVY